MHSADRLSRSAGIQRTLETSLRSLMVGRDPKDRAPTALALRDGGQDPAAAAAAHEGPDFGCLGPYLRIALDDRAVGNATGHVDHAEPHRDAGVIAAAFAPRL